MNLGIIIPYRDREENLKRSAPILKQYGALYVIEQMDDKPFNRGKLINCGFIEFKKEFDYFAAHDCDMIPYTLFEDSGNYYFRNHVYNVCENPCQIATQVEQFKWGVPYPRYMGGVTLLPNDKFEMINGFSNEFYGYGGEDDLLRKRFEQKGIIIESRQCRFKSLPHEINIDHDLRMKNFHKLKEPIDWNDGLSNCNYEIVHCEDLEHYTLLQVKL